MGLVGIVAFACVETLFIKEPTVRKLFSSNVRFANVAPDSQMPRFCFTNKTTLSGYMIEWVIKAYRLLTGFLLGTLVPSSMA